MGCRSCASMDKGDGIWTPLDRGRRIRPLPCASRSWREPTSLAGPIFNLLATGWKKGGQFDGGWSYKSRQTLGKMARAGEEKRGRKIGEAPSGRRYAGRGLVFSKRAILGGKVGDLLDRLFLSRNHANIGLGVLLAFSFSWRCS
jgi:hypothetical protein